jgi:hypothetical protein
MPGYPGFDQPVDLHDHRSAEPGRAPLTEAHADRHPQPDPVVMTPVVLVQAGRQGPDQHGEHDGRVDGGRQDRVDPVPGPLVVDDPRVEFQPAFREYRDDKLPQALLHPVLFRRRPRPVGGDVEDESHAQRAAVLPPRARPRASATGFSTSPSVSHFFPTLPWHSVIAAFIDRVGRIPLSALKIWQNLWCAICAFPPATSGACAQKRRTAHDRYYR